MAITPRDKKPGDEDKELALDIHIEDEPDPDADTHSHDKSRRMLEQDSGSALGRALDEAKRLSDPLGIQRSELHKALGAFRDFSDRHKETFGKLSSLQKLGEEYAENRRAMDRMVADSVHVLPAIRSPFPSKMEVELSERDRADADRRAGLADAMVAGVMQRVAEFQDNLADDEEVLVVLANFGTGISIHVEFIYWEDSHLLIFDGVDSNGCRVRLMQHAAQCNLLLCASKVVAEEERPARRIGFHNPGRT